MLAACAGPKITALDVEIARAQAEAQRACWAAEAEAAKASPLYADARDQAIVIMAQALSGQNKTDRCATTNVYDSRARIAESQNQAAASAVGGVMQGVAVTAGIIAGADVIKTAVRNTGGSISGDGNTVYDTRSNVSNRQQGDGASMSAPATGPDMSQSSGGPPPGGGQGGNNGQGAKP